MIKINLHKTLKSGESTFDLNLDFSVKKGDFVSIYGPSGAGKSTLLRLIAGLDSPEKGFIKIENEIWYSTEQKVNLKPQSRKIGMVFQDYALFPNMTVRQNLEFALKKGQSDTIINDLINSVELGDLAQQKPSTLSGGQKQRVALARALVQQPDILLLDEPLSALDDAMREKLQNYILDLHQRYNLTTFLVSHDLSEIFKMTNLVVQLNKGSIQNIGKPETLFLNRAISGKYQSSGRIIAIEKADTVYIVSVLSGPTITKVVATNQTIADLSVGDQVTLVSKAFNPLIIKHIKP